MKKFENLSKEDKIKKLKLDNKVRFLLICLFLPIIIGLGIYLIIIKEPAKLGIGFLLSAPISLLMGYIIPVKDAKENIKKLEDECSIIEK